MWNRCRFDRDGAIAAKKKKIKKIRPILHAVSGVTAVIPLVVGLDGGETELLKPFLLLRPKNNRSPDFLKCHHLFLRFWATLRLLISRRKAAGGRGPPRPPSLHSAVSCYLLCRKPGATRGRRG